MLVCTSISSPGIRFGALLCALTIQDEAQGQVHVLGGLFDIPEQPRPLCSWGLLPS